MQDMDAVYRQNAQTVFKYLMSLTHDADLAEELTQETFYQAVRSIDRFDESCKITTWLCAIAKNAYHKHRRRSARMVGADALVTQPAETDFVERFLDREQAQQIYRHVHELGAQYKEVFLLRTLGELSFRDIADIFGKSESWRWICCRCIWTAAAAPTAVRRSRRTWTPALPAGRNTRSCGAI